MAALHRAAPRFSRPARPEQGLSDGQARRASSRGVLSLGRRATRGELVRCSFDARELMCAAGERAGQLARRPSRDIHELRPAWSIEAGEVDAARARRSTAVAGTDTPKGHDRDRPGSAHEGADARDASARSARSADHHRAADPLGDELDAERSRRHAARLRRAETASLSARRPRGPRALRTLAARARVSSPPYGRRAVSRPSRRRSTSRASR